MERAVPERAAHYRLARPKAQRSAVHVTRACSAHLKDDGARQARARPRPSIGGGRGSIERQTRDARTSCTRLENVIEFADIERRIEMVEIQLRAAGCLLRGLGVSPSVIYSCYRREHESFHGLYADSLFFRDPVIGYAEKCQIDVGIIKVRPGATQLKGADIAVAIFVPGVLD